MANDVPRDIPDEVQRWTAKRRVALGLSILKGGTTVFEVARNHRLIVGWRVAQDGAARGCAGWVK